MSVKLMTTVWESALPSNKKFVALCYADFADDSGNGIFPSTDYVAWKTGHSRRQIQTVTDQLVSVGILIYLGRSHYHTNLYRLDVSKLPQRQSWNPDPRVWIGGRPVGSRKQGAEIAPPFQDQNGDSEQKQGEVCDKQGEIRDKQGEIRAQNLSQISPDSLVNPLINSLIDSSIAPSAQEQPEGNQEQDHSEDQWQSPDDTGSNTEVHSGKELLENESSAAAPGKKGAMHMSHPAVKIFRGICKITPKEAQRQRIVDQVTDLDQWAKDVRHWSEHGWNQYDILPILDFHAKGGADTCSKCNNRPYQKAGRRQAGNGPAFKEPKNPSLEYIRYNPKDDHTFELIDTLDPDLLEQFIQKYPDHQRVPDIKRRLGMTVH